MIKRDKIIWALFLNHSCNLSCKYCYLKKINDGNKIEENTLKKLIDRIFQYSREKNKIPEIGFFGKEPMLDFELIKFAVSYLKTTKAVYNLSVNTNGTLLDIEKIDYLIKNNFKLVISLDTKISEKKGIPPWISHKKENIEFRTTINSQNISLLSKLIKQVSEGGWYKLSVAFDYTDKGFLKLTHNKIADYLTESLIVYTNIKTRKEFVSPFFDRLIDLKFMTQKSEFLVKPFCSLGERIISIDVNGDVYPCWRFVGNERFRIGNLLDGIIQKNEFKIKLDSTNKKKVGMFNFICYWAYQNGDIELKNNIKVMEAIRVTSQRIKYG